MGVRFPWKGGVLVDGPPWPAVDDGSVWLPGGAHSVEAAPLQVGPRLSAERAACGHGVDRVTFGSRLS